MFQMNGLQLYYVIIIMIQILQPDRYSRFLHDAFYLFCLAYNYTISNNLTTTGENIFKAVSQLRFVGKIYSRECVMGQGGQGMEGV